MTNQRGSVLIVTLGFVLVFLMLGLATIRHATLQSEMADQMIASSKAFWIAEAGIEDAKNQYPNLIPASTPATSFADGNYDVESAQVNTGSNENLVFTSYGDYSINHLDGTINTKKRAIEAKYGTFDIESAIMTHGTINGGCGPQGSASISGTCVANHDFSFETIFNGMTYADFVSIASAANQKFDLSSPSDAFDIEDVTVLNYNDNLNKITLNTDDPSVYDGTAAFVIVDTTGYTGNPTPNLDITGNIDFCGIVWVIGEMKITGNPDINGTVFIDGDPNEDTNFTGNVDLNFDLQCISDAISSFGGTGPPSFYYWKELAI